MKPFSDRRSTNRVRSHQRCARRAAGIIHGEHSADLLAHHRVGRSVSVQYRGAYHAGKDV